MGLCVFNVGKSTVAFPSFESRKEYFNFKLTDLGKSQMTLHVNYLHISNHIDSLTSNKSQIWGATRKKGER